MARSGAMDAVALFLQAKTDVIHQGMGGTRIIDFQGLLCPLSNAKQVALLFAENP